MKYSVALLILSLALTMVLAQDGPPRGPHPDCPDLKTLITSKCTDRTDKDCFRCVFNGCGPKPGEEISSPPTCEQITSCVNANIANC